MKKQEKIFRPNISFILKYTVVEKSFWTPLKFYTISNIIMKYLWKNLFCVSKGVAALNRHKQIQMIFFFVYCLQEKLTKLNSFSMSVLNIVGIKVNK